NATVAGESSEEIEDERSNSGRRESLHRRKRRQSGEHRKEIQGLVRRSAGGESYRRSAQIKGRAEADHSEQSREGKEGERMTPRVKCNPLGSARASRVGDRVLAITDFFGDGLLKQRLLRRDAATSTRDACATRTGESM